MTCVVDASVALKWFIAEEPHWPEALGLVQSGEILIAPDLLVAETCNAGWRSLRSARVAYAQLERIATALPQYITEFVRTAPLAPRAVAIAVQLDHPVYDCLYFALAEARQVPLVTADGRLLAKLTGSPWAGLAIHIADYRSVG